MGGRAAAGEDLLRLQPEQPRQVARGALLPPAPPRRHRVSMPVALGGAGADLSHRLHHPHRARPPRGRTATRGTAFCRAKQDLGAILGVGGARMSLVARRAVARPRGRLRYRAQPGWIAPMLATLADRAALGRRLGLRAQARRRAGAGLRDGRERCGCSPATGSRSKAAIPSWWRRSRSRSGATRCSTARSWPSDPGDRAQRHFSRLQQRMQLRDEVRATRTGVAVELYLFDCLFYEGIDLTGLPLVDRKTVLRDVVWYDDPIHFTPLPHDRLRGDVPRRLRQGRRGHHREAGRIRYVSARSTDWLKIKCVHQQEFVIGGYTAPQGSREHLGALLVGYYETRERSGTRARSAPATTGPRWRCCTRKLAPLHRRTSPFAPGPVAGGRGPVGDAEAGGADRIRGVDRGGAAAASALPRPQGGQDGAGSAAGGAQDDRKRGETARKTLIAPSVPPPPPSRRSSPAAPSAAPHPPPAPRARLRERPRDTSPRPTA